MKSRLCDGFAAACPPAGTQEGQCPFPTLCPRRQTHGVLALSREFIRRSASARFCAILTVAFLVGCLSPAIAQTPDASPAPGSVTPLAGVQLKLGHLSGTFDQAQVENARVIYNNELTVQADTLRGNLLTQEYLATGSVSVHEADTTLTTDALRFDGKHNVGVTENATLVQPMFTLKADQITVNASTLHADEARVSNTPPGVSPDFEVRAGTVDFYPKENRGVLRRASLYLFRAHIITLRHVPFSYGQGSSTRRQVVLPSVGYSSRYGAYLTFGGSLSGPAPIHYRVLLPTRQAPQIRLTVQQTLLTRPNPMVPAAPNAFPARRDYLGGLRKLATATRPPLPPGDPLLFHSYLPEASDIRPLDGPPAGQVLLHEEVSSHIESQGRLRDLVYVSRLPEVALSGQLPLNAVPPPPPVGDPLALRQSLRHLVLLANAEAGVGYYEEQPLNRRAARQRLSVGLTTRPLLIAPNTLFLPRLQMTVNYYSGQRNTYRYLQAGGEISRYFSPYSAVALGVVAATTHGDSPFGFDVLETTREFDARVQVGNRRLAVGAMFRYDIQRHEILDYRLAVAPGLRGITPVISYNFRSRSVGLGVDLTALSF